MKIKLMCYYRRERTANTILITFKKKQLIVLQTPPNLPNRIDF